MIRNGIFHLRELHPLTILFQSPVAGVEQKRRLIDFPSANIRSFVVINLKRAGYEAIEAETGEEALAQLKRNPDIKVALLDIMLPDIQSGRCG